MFLPERLLRLQVLEILREPGTIKTTGTQIGHEMREPGAAEQAARDAHWIDTGLTRPIRQGRTVKHNRTGETAAISSQQSQCPAGLTVTIENRLAAIVAPGDFLDEAAQHVLHIVECLADDRLRKEDHEIDRVPDTQRDPHFRIAFEPADPGAMSGTRIHDHDRRLVGIDTVARPVAVDFGDL